MPSSPITMRQIAEAAGVSRSTVSRALKGDPQIPALTRDRVCRMAAKMGYQRDPAYDILAAKRWNHNERIPRFNLAFLMLTYFNEQTWEGASQRAQELGYHLEKLSARQMGDAAAIDRILRARSIRGILLPPFFSASGLPNLRWERYAVVCTGIDRVRPPFHAVRPNVVSKIDIAWQKAHERGYKRIGVALPTDTHNELDRRRIGVALYHSRHLPAADKIPVWEGGFQDRDGFLEWYHTHRPDCIVAGTSALLGWLLKIDTINIPQTCGFITLVFQKLEEEIDVTGLDSQNRRVGEVAMNLLDQQIKQNQAGVPDAPFTVVIEPAWHEGTTLPGIH